MRATHELEVAAPPAEVWAALTEPDRTRQWYHGTLVEADWTPGGAVTYRMPEGMELEAGVVAAVEPGRRLEVETRFLFDAKVRDEPAHRTSWTLEPAPAGTLVRVTYEVPDEASWARHWIGEEGGYVLQGLRLAVDPAEQARVARRDEIGEVEIRDVTPDLIGDYQRFFDEVGFQDHPDWQGCYCGETNLPPSTRLTVAETRAEMSRLLQAGEVTALLAYADGGPVAWCNYGETTRLAGVMAKLGFDGAEHGKVGSVACFVISSRYRRHGIARRLLDEACARLRRRGCTAVEAYPPKDSDSDYSNYRGPLRMYLESGFSTYREAGRNLIVRKPLS